MPRRLSDRDRVQRHGRLGYRQPVIAVDARDLLDDVLRQRHVAGGPPGRHRDAETVIVLLGDEPERAQGGVDRLVAQVLADPVDQELPVHLDLRVAGGLHEHVLHAVDCGTRRDLGQQVQE